ncbi:MAG: hypothetical protein WC799_17575 [Desulfobacteraceae bacterium]
MTLRYLSMIIVVASCLWTSGCATVLTVAYPPLEETRHGETKPGSQVAFHYVMSEEKDSLLLQKQPLCSQQIQIIKIKRKQLHGVIPAIVEVPFFGLGIADLVVAGVYTRATVEESDGGYVKGVEIMACGDLMFAPNEELIIQYPTSTDVKHMRTNEKGMIPLNSLEHMPKGENSFNVFVKEEKGVSFVKTFEKNPR